VVIRQAITRSIADQARTIRIPVHMIETINKLNRISRQMIQEMAASRPPRMAVKRRCRKTRCARCLKIAKEPISMRRPSATTRIRIWAISSRTRTRLSPVEQATNASLHEATHQILSSLTPREAKVLRMRFGIDMNTDHTLERSRQAVRCHPRAHPPIRSQALRKLRHPSRANYLRSFLDEQ